jgi:hypothetical protein
MTMKDPPRIASWMLEHLTFGSKSEALAGDLLEEFRQGRSIAWYWRQVVAAILIGLASLLRTQWIGISYAILWAIPSPAFFGLAVPKLMALPLFVQRWKLAWPYSTICDLLLYYGSHFLYLWLALVLYFGVVSRASRTFNLSRLWKSFWMSASVFVVIGLAQFAVYWLLPRHIVHVIGRQITALELITGSFSWALRLPIFFSLLSSILMTFPRVEKGTRAAA